MGFIPVYVYSDVAWVPYSDLFHSIGFVTGLGNLSNTLNAVRVLLGNIIIKEKRNVVVGRVLHLDETKIHEIFRLS